jgi:hypothetical protein
VLYSNNSNGKCYPQQPGPPNYIFGWLSEAASLLQNVLFGNLWGSELWKMNLKDLKIETDASGRSILSKSLLLSYCSRVAPNLE